MKLKLPIEPKAVWCKLRRPNPPADSASSADLVAPLSAQCARLGLVGCLRASLLVGQRLLRELLSPLARAFEHQRAPRRPLLLERPSLVRVCSRAVQCLF